MCQLLTLALLAVSIIRSAHLFHQYVRSQPNTMPFNTSNIRVAMMQLKTRPKE